jgi:hypothetical protein
MMERGNLVIVNLRDPREQIWGILHRLDGSGIEMRGIDLANFEEWCRQLARAEEPQLGPTTIFFPAHRIDRVTLDERVGAVPSFRERFEEILSDQPERFLTR